MRIVPDKIAIGTALAVALGLLAVGCGGGAGSQTSSEAVTKASYIAQADKICAAAESRKNQALKTAMVKAEKSSETRGRAAEEELVVTVALPPISQMTEELSGLDLPESLEVQAREVVAAFEAGVHNVEAQPSIAFLGNSEPFAKADTLAKRNGLTACAEI
jgi:hypothetical protein